MIAQWMFGALMFATLCGIAALAAEHVQKLFGRPNRLPWLLALSAAVSWPFLAPLALDSIAPELLSPVTTASIIANGGLPTTASQASLLSALWSGQFDRHLAIAWAFATALLIAQTVVAIAVLRRIRRRAARKLVHGEFVLIDDALGPAVIGIVQPAIVLPTWLLELDHQLQALVVRHEREHCQSRDAALVWLSVIATTVVPWNVAIWWIARRLRTAMEIDCDTRTLRGTNDQTRYAKLLLLIAQHKSSARFAPALSHSTSQLHRRIRAMKTPNIRFRTVHVVMASGIAILATATACSSRVASNLLSPANGSSVATAVPVTGDNYPTAETPPYFDFQVTNPVSVAAGAKGPVYPAGLRAAKKQGQVLAQFVVNVDGAVDVKSIKILKTDDEQFSASVRTALVDMRFTPASLNGRAVRQLVQQPFVFSIRDERSKASSTPTVPQTPDTRVNAPVLKPAQLRPTSTSASIYPKELRDSGLEGSVLVQFVVGRDGNVDMSTLKVVKSDHELFTAAVRTALESMQFDPATKDGEPVRQMLQMPFQFSVPKTN